MNRVTIMSGLRGLKACGYKLPGYDERGDSADVWHTVLAQFTDEQLRKAFKKVAESHTFNEVRPAHIASAIRDSAYQGAGKGDVLALDGWHRWKDENGYEYAWHPSMPADTRCGCPRCRYEER